MTIVLVDSGFAIYHTYEVEREPGNIIEVDGKERKIFQRLGPAPKGELLYIELTN